MAGHPGDPRVAAALRAAGRPLRLDILFALKAAGSLTPSGFARTHGATLRESSYHFRALREGELIALEELRFTAGAAEHHYVLTPLGRELTRVLPRLERAA